MNLTNLMSALGKLSPPETLFYVGRDLALFEKSLGEIKPKRSVLAIEVPRKYKAAVETYKTKSSIEVIQAVFSVDSEAIYYNLWPDNKSGTITPSRLKAYWPNISETSQETVPCQNIETFWRDHNLATVNWLILEQLGSSSIIHNIDLSHLDVVIVYGLTNGPPSDSLTIPITALETKGLQIMFTEKGSHPEFGFAVFYNTRKIQVQTLKMQTFQSSQQIKNLNEQLSKATEHSNLLDTELSASSNLIATLNQTVTNESRLKRRQDKEIEDLKQRINALEADLQKSVEEAQKSLEAHKSTKQELQSKKRFAEKLEKEKAELNARITAADQRFHSIQDKKDEIKKNLMSSTKRVATLERALSDLEKGKLNLENKLIVADKKSKTLEQTLNDLKNSKLSLENKLIVADKKSKALEQTINDLEKGKLNLESKLIDANKKSKTLANLKRDMQLASAKLDAETELRTELTAAHQVSEQNLTKTKTELSQTQKKLVLAEKNLSSHRRKFRDLKRSNEKLLSDFYADISVMLDSLDDT